MVARPEGSEKITRCSELASPAVCASAVMLAALPTGWSALPRLACVRTEEKEGTGTGLGAGGPVRWLNRAVLWV